MHSGEKDESNKQIKLISKDNFIFSLIKDEKEAHLIGNDSCSCDIIIPTSIKHENQEYFITVIKKKFI